MSRPNSGLEIQRDFADRFPTDFETELLADCIHDGLRADVELAQLCDAAGLADEAADTRRESETQPVKEAWGILRHQARQRALEVVAQNCAVVIQQADRWDHDAETVDAAQQEAAEWLRHHSNEAARADVLGVAAEVA